ncbi:hypothetical protein L209DRAFT_781442 [Thermothelomyces heterothallicus CBS 203.75]
MTCVGSSARLWIFSERSTYLIPFIPAGQGLAERSEYLEISTYGREIADGLEYIKKHMTPPRELLNTTPSPRPANATLPAGWHDSEVIQLDAFRQRDAASPTSADAMDFGPGLSTPATAQLPQEAYDGLGDETPGWVTGDELHGNPAYQFEADSYLEAGSSEEHHRGDGRKEVEVKSSTEDDWVKEKRDQRTVWVYRYGTNTVYWTKKLG